MTAIDRDELLHLLNRRRFLAGSAALAAVPLMPWRALAQDKPHSFRVGEAEVTVISDGSITLPLNVLSPDASPEQLAEIAKRLGWGDAMQPAINAALIRSGADLILVDNGSKGFQPTSGKLVESLAAAGVEPGAITKVVFTHAHLDHILGTVTEGGALLAPNATYHVGATEWDFWTDPDLLSKMPAEMADFVTGAQSILGAVKDRVTMVKEGDSIADGLSVLATPGHTPGHISLLLSGGEGLIITGDAATNEIVSFEHPDWKFGFDADPAQAIASRKALLDRAVADKNRLLGYHWTYPGVGFAEKKGAAYAFAKG